MHLGQHLVFYAFKPLTHFYKFENVELAIFVLYQSRPSDQGKLCVKNETISSLTSHYSIICKQHMQKHTLISRHHTANKVSST